MYESTVRHIDCIIPVDENKYKFNVGNSKPLSTFSMKHLEAKTFPTLFLNGVKDFDEKRPHIIHRLLLYFQARLLNIDNRWSSCPAYLFWALNKYEQEKVQSCINIALKMR